MYFINPAEAALADFAHDFPPGEMDIFIHGDALLLSLLLWTTDTLPAADIALTIVI